MLKILYLIYITCNGWLAAKHTIKAYRTGINPIAVGIIYLISALFGSIIYAGMWLYGFISGLLMALKTRK